MTQNMTKSILNRKTKTTYQQLSSRDKGESKQTMSSVFQIPVDAMRRIEEEESKESYLGSPAVPDTLSRPWTDDDIDQIKIHEIVHMSNSRNDTLFCRWLSCGDDNVKSVRLYLALTVYIGTQLRDPETKEYVFPGRIIPDDKVEEESEIRDDNTTLLPILKKLNMSNIGKTESEGIKSDIFKGSNEYVRSLIVPAYALFALRVVYRSGFNVNDANATSRLGNQMALFYNLERTEMVDAKYPFDYQEQCSQQSFIGTMLINTALVPALKYATDPTTCDITRSILNYCFLLHARWNGMAAISRLIVVCKRDRKEPMFLLRLSRVASTVPFLEKVKDFFKRHMSTQQSSRYAPWCRALSNTYEAEISNTNQLPVIAIWTFLIDFTGEKDIWKSQVLRNLSPADYNIAAKIARLILDYYEVIKGTPDDKNKEFGQAIQNCTMSAEEMLRHYNAKFGSRQGGQSSSGILPENILPLSGKGAGIGRTN